MVRSSAVRRGLWLALAWPSFACAQAPGSEPIDDEQLLRTLEAGCEVLRQADKLVALGDLHRAPPPRAVELRLTAPHADVRDVPALYERARASSVIVGIYYQCSECDRWHLDAAGGFPLTADGAVATCWHVLEQDPERRAAHPVVADLAGHVWAVSGVLAADVESDVCILATGMAPRVPLPLRAAPRVGESVVCLSHPEQRFAFFSEGRIARSFISREPPPAEKAGDEPGADKAAASAPLPPGVPALEVTVDFAQGSSGAAILDVFGNAVAMAQATQTILYDFEKGSDVQMVVKIAAPAQAVLGLVRAPK
jgi:hypothetical protein